MKKRITALVMAVILGSVMLPAQAFASTRTVLAMGDSISAGYGLANVDTECFVSIIGTKGYQTVNKAVSGNRAPDILAQLNDPDNDNHITADEIRAAELITVTCGGNDMMDVLYERTAEIWNAQNPNKQISADEITSMFASGLSADALGLIEIALDLLNSDSSSYMITDPAFASKLGEYIDALNDITAYIHEINPLAEIIVATQYNPYVEFKGETVNLLIKQYPIGYLYSGIEDGANMLNDAIRENAETGEYSVADVKQAFDSYSGSEDLYNSFIDRSSFIPKIGVDFHPTAAGHALIAETFLAAMEAPRYLTVTDETGTVHRMELPLDVGVTAAVVGYRDDGSMADIMIRICSGRNYSGEISGSSIKVFFLKTGTLVPIQSAVEIK